MKKVEYKFLLRDTGDWSVGLRSWESQVVLSIEDSEIDDDFNLFMKESLAEYYECECLTEKEMKKEEDEV